MEINFQKKSTLTLQNETPGLIVIATMSAWIVWLSLHRFRHTVLIFLLSQLVFPILVSEITATTALTTQFLLSLGWCIAWAATIFEWPPLYSFLLFVVFPARGPLLHKITSFPTAIPTSSKYAARNAFLSTKQLCWLLSTPLATISFSCVHNVLASQRNLKSWNLSTMSFKSLRLKNFLEVWPLPR